MSLECGSIHQQRLLCRSSLPQRRLGSSRRPLQAFAESLEFDRGPEELRPAEDLRAVCCIPIFNAVTGHRAVSVCVCMVDQVKPKLGSCFQVHWRARHVYCFSAWRSKRAQLLSKHRIRAHYQHFLTHGFVLSHRLYIAAMLANLAQAQVLCVPCVALT